MRNSRASLFLMELMISILFFAISGAVCIQLFVKAHTINEETAAKSKATLIAQDICEYYHYTNGNKADMLSYYWDYEETEDSILLYFTESGDICSSVGATYVATLTFGQELSYHILPLDIKSTDEQESLYSTKIKKYVQATL